MRLRTFTSAETFDIRKRFNNKENASSIAKRHKTSTQKIRTVVADIIATERGKSFLTGVEVYPLIDDLKLKLSECKKRLDKLDKLTSECSTLALTMNSALERLVKLERKIK